MPPVTPRTMRFPASIGRRRSGLGLGGSVAVRARSASPSTASSVAGTSSGRSAHLILSAAISWKPMLNGLRAAVGTCGGTMWPRPSPSWLK